LWKYNLTTKIWSRYSVLHGRQLARRKMCNGKNGNLYISNWNTGDVLKVSTLVPNTYLALRTDYTPEMIMFDERADKILVHTGKDKIVAINRQTDEAVVILNTMGICTAISERTSDNAYWFVSEDFTTKMNIDKTTMLKVKDANYSFSLNAPWLKLATKIIIIPEHTIINHNNGQPLLIHEYVCAIADKLYLFRNKNNFYEENYVEITGQGMIYSGNDFYTGESL
jgi:hypothetical protein